MSSQHTGWVIGIAGLGMMCGLLAVDVSQMRDFHEALTPAFVGSTLGHIASVITAFVGGKLIPTDAQPGGRRGTDPQP